MANLNGKTTVFTILTIFVIAKAWTLPTSDRLRRSVPQFVSNNLDYDSIQPNSKELTSVTSVVEQSTMNTQNEEDNFIIYSLTSNRPSMSTPKVSSDSNIIRAQVIENTGIDKKPSENESNVEPSVTKAEDTKQYSVKNHPEDDESIVETTITQVQIPVTTEESIKSVLEYEGSSVEPSNKKVEDPVPTQQSVKSVSEHTESSVTPIITTKPEETMQTQQSTESTTGNEESSVKTSITEGHVPVTTEQSMKSVSEHTESSVEPMITAKAEKSPQTQQSVENIPGHEESSVERSVTKGQVPVSTEESLSTSFADSENVGNPPIEITNAPATTIIEDKEESLTTKPPNSATSSCINSNPPLINETIEQSGTKSCFPDLNLAEVHKDNVTDSAPSIESPTENNQETTTIRLCDSCDNQNDLNNNKPTETVKHIVDDKPENHPTTAPNQSTTNVENTIFSTSTESSIPSELTIVMDPTLSITEIPFVPIETATIIQVASQPSTSEMNQPIETNTIISQPNDFGMASQSDPNSSSAPLETTITIIYETMPPKMSEINESEESTTIISQTTADPETTPTHDHNSNASILTSYHILKHLIILCVLIIFQKSSYCI